MDYYQLMRRTGSLNKPQNIKNNTHLPHTCCCGLYIIINMHQQNNNHSFFQQYAKQLTSVAQNHAQQHAHLNTLRKIANIQNTPPSTRNLPQKLVDNLVIDYFRSHQLDYCYSIFMRERNLISDEIISKQQLREALRVKQQERHGGQLNVAVIELVLDKYGQLNENLREVNQYGIQVELINKDKAPNSLLLNQIRIAEVRKEIQNNQKKHYTALLESLRAQLTISIQQQLKKQHQNKSKELKNYYEQQVALLKQKNQQVLLNNPKMNPKVQEYLFKMEELEGKVINFQRQVNQLQKQKISHNCFKNSRIVQKEEQLRKELGSLKKRREQYQLALKNLHTSVEQLALKKDKLNQTPRNTDIFISQTQKNKKNKDYMIEEIYGRMFAMEKRIQNLTKDNDTLREENRQFRAKVRQLQEHKTQPNKSTLQNTPTGINKLYQAKPQSKDVILNVSQKEIGEGLNDKRKEHAIDQMQDDSSSSQCQDLQLKQARNLQIKRISGGMQLIKNKLRLMAQGLQ